MARAKSRDEVKLWRPPIVAEIVGEGVRTWGGGQWNNEEVREALVVLVADGLGLKKALEKLEEFGKMPSMWLIGKWMRELDGFKEAYDGALEIRGHCLVEDALDDVNSAETKDQIGSAKVKAEHKRWMASKFSRKFTDRKIIEEEPAQKVSDTELRNQIYALLMDPEVKGALADAGQILDVEVESSEPVESSESQ